MIKYCENIRPDVNGNNGQEIKNNVKAEDINLQKQKGWEKEAKSGCVVIVGKKQVADEEQPKKPKKEKKVKVEENDDSLHHSIDSMNRFHDLNVLPPSNASEIDNTIKQLREKIEILNKPSEEDVQAFKAKAEKEFDRIHGFHDEDEAEE